MNLGMYKFRIVRLLLGAEPSIQFHMIVAVLKLG